PRALPRQPPPTGVEEERGRAALRAAAVLPAPLGRRPPTTRAQHPTRPDPIGLDGGRGVRTDRAPPPPAALAAQQDLAAVPLGVQVQIVDVEPDRLGDAGAGAVEELERRLVAESERRVARAGDVQDALHLVDRERLRQPSWRRGRADRTSR